MPEKIEATQRLQKKKPLLSLKNSCIISLISKKGLSKAMDSGFPLSFIEYIIIFALALGIGFFVLDTIVKIREIHKKIFSSDESNRH